MAQMARDREPLPPLREVFDFPIKTEVPPSIRAQIEALESQVEQTAQQGDWLPLYDEAISITEQLLQEAGGRHEALQHRLHSMDDPMELKQRLIQEPRKKAEAIKASAKTALQKSMAEWVDRSRRQKSLVEGPVLQDARDSMLIEEQTTDSGLSFSFPATWWSEHTEHAVRCADAWTDQATAGAEAEFAARVAEACAPLQGQPLAPQAPVPSPKPQCEWRSANSAPERRADIPGFWSAFGQAVRQNFMMVSMAGMVIGGIGVGVGRSEIFLIALVPLLIFGKSGADKRRETALTKARDSHKDAFTAHVKTETQALLAEHQKTIERWISKRGEDWQQSLDAWFKAHIEPTFSAGDYRAQEQIRNAKLERDKLAEKAGELKSFRGAAKSKILVDLKRRQRTLRKKSQGEAEETGEPSPTPKA